MDDQLSAAARLYASVYNTERKEGSSQPDARSAAERAVKHFMDLMKMAS